MESKNKFWKGILIGSLVTAFAGLVIVGMSAGIFLIGRSMIRSQVQAQNGSPAGEKDNGSGIRWNEVEVKAKRLQEIIDHYFLFDEDQENVEEFIFKGMMAGLDDPYSVYYTEDEFMDLMEETSGEYCGIGAMVSKNMVTGIISVAKVFKGTPAEEAGLRVGDIFYQVDDVEVTTDLDLDILVKQHVKGEEGTMVHLKMFRPAAEDYVEMDVVRRQIEVPTVEYEMKAHKAGYIIVSQFDTVTTEQFKSALDDLEGQGMEGLVIDLRGNPGGVLDTAVAMIDYMLPDDLDEYSQEKGKTLVVSTADKNEQGDKFYCEDGHSIDIHTVILIDGNSASASEVFAGAMRDYGRAKLVGTTSFGKGIVQTLLPLGDGSAVKLTTAHYYSPSGFDLHGVGLEPDVEIAYELPKEDEDKAAEGKGQEDGEAASEDGNDGADEQDGAGRNDGAGEQDSAGRDDGQGSQAALDGDGNGNSGQAGNDGEAAEELYDNQLEKALEVLDEMIEDKGKAGAFAA